MNFKIFKMRNYYYLLSCLLFSISIIGCYSDKLKNDYVLVNFTEKKSGSYEEYFHIIDKIPINKASDTTNARIFPVTRVFKITNNSTFIVFSRNVETKEVKIFKINNHGEIISNFGSLNPMYNLIGVVDLKVNNDTIYLLDYFRGEIRVYNSEFLHITDLKTPYNYSRFALLNSAFYVFDSDGSLNGASDNHEFLLYNNSSNLTHSFLKVNSNPNLQVGIIAESFSNLHENTLYFVRQHDPNIYSVDKNGFNIYLNLKFEPNNFVTLNNVGNLTEVDELISKENGIFRLFCLNKYENGICFFTFSSTLNERYFINVINSKSSVYKIQDNVFAHLPLNSLGPGIFTVYVENNDNNIGSDFILVLKLKEHLMK